MKDIFVWPQSKWNVADSRENGCTSLVGIRAEDKVINGPNIDGGCWLRKLAVSNRGKSYCEAQPLGASATAQPDTLATGLPDETKIQTFFFKQIQTRQTNEQSLTSDAFARRALRALRLGTVPGTSSGSSRCSGTCAFHIARGCAGRGRGWAILRNKKVFV